MAKATGDYGVKLIRGPVLDLPSHRDHCDDPQQLRGLVDRIRAHNPGALLAADLFSGAGGMSLGLRDAGFDVVLSADHDRDALQTHAHHFGGMAIDWDLGQADNVARVAELVRELGIDLLAGGPPCQPFSKAGRSGIRYRVQHGMRDPYDQRRDLWRSFLEVVQLALPRAVLMENVPDMALDREMFILRSMVEELEQLGYTVHERIVDSREYGVPQFRQRLILAAVRDGGAFSWPPVQAQQVTVWNAIGELPEVEGGWRPTGGAEGWTDYPGAETSYQQLMRAGMTGRNRTRVHDHITRPVRDDDAVAFDHMDSTTRYSELPDEVKRYREDIFDDKYKRLNENDLSRTITAHIARDGYWYIHPRQGRTITIREAARLQSFPDHFRFSGPPTAAFRQIGNAVPPLLAQALGTSVRDALTSNRAQDGPGQTSGPGLGVPQRLTEWFADLSERSAPWLLAETRWQVLCAETLFQRLSPAQAAQLWPPLRMMRTPQDSVDNAEDLRELASWVGREDRAEKLISVASMLIDDPDRIDAPDLEARQLPGLSGKHVDLAVLAVDLDGAEEPILTSQGLLRVARRFFGDNTAADEQMLDRQNKNTDGRLAVARIVGGGPQARAAHLALFELAATLCTTGSPSCAQCPLSDACRYGRQVVVTS